MQKKKRLDVLLVEKGLVSSREKAKADIMAGLVLVNEQRVDKAGTFVNETARIVLKGNQIPYVSRGGLKLAQAITAFHLDLKGMVVADIGASTGGFTDCALQNGAVKVFAIDVGYGQLAWQLRNDPRVVVLERTNVRYVQEKLLGEPVDLATIDVSFISLTKVLPAVGDLLKPAGRVVALIKPQFEAGRENVGKKGVVKDAKVHIQVIQHIIQAARELAFSVCDLSFSPIKGPEGNIEYLALLSRSGNNDYEIDRVPDLVAQAHAALD